MKSKSDFIFSGSAPKGLEVSYQEPAALASPDCMLNIAFRLAWEQSLYPAVQDSL
jgi:hypothetical protein